MALQIGIGNWLGNKSGGSIIPLRNNLAQWLFKENQPSFSGNYVIDYSGNERNGLLIKSNCLDIVTNITITLSTPRIGATVTELNTSASNLTGVTINASGHIEINRSILLNSKIWQIKLSTGEEFIFSIGVLNKIYSVSSIANIGTLSGVVTTNWIWSTQDEYHYNIKNGCNPYYALHNRRNIKQITPKYTENWILECEVYLTSTGILLNKNGVNTSYIFPQSSSFNFRLFTVISFTTLGTTVTGMLNNWKKIKIQNDITQGIYGSLTVTISNLDGSNSFSETKAHTSAYYNENLDGNYFFALSGGWDTFPLSSGSLLKSLSFNSFDALNEYNFFAPKKTNLNTDVLGLQCINEGLSVSEAKIKLNPDNDTVLTNLGYDQNFERTIFNINSINGKEFCVKKTNYSDLILYETPLDYIGILNLYAWSKEKLGFFYKVGTKQTLKTIKQGFASVYGLINNGITFILTDNLYEEVQIIPGDYTRIIGRNRPTIRGYQNPNTPILIIENNSTLHVSACKYFIFDNFKVTAQNLRYAIHDDYTLNGGVHIINNVEAIHFGNDEAIAYWAPTAVFTKTASVGGGFSNGGYFEFNNFKSLGYTKGGLNYRGFFFHTNDVALPSTMIIRNSEFDVSDYNEINYDLSFQNNDVHNTGDRIDFVNVKTQKSAKKLVNVGTYQDHHTVAGSNPAVINGYVILAP